MVMPPSGTIAFLFTDIEGSSQRWDEHPDQMREGLARHDAVLREVIERHCGYVFKTMGDAFTAAWAEGRALSLDAAVALALEQV
jgi:class 3 adenylate cyclase